jgi:hypothetical protein
MEELASSHRDASSPDMIDVTHAENGAWAKVWQDGKGMYREIPYTLGLEDDDPRRDTILAIAREQDAIRETHASRR